MTEIADLHARQLAYFRSGRTRPLEFRRASLLRLARALRASEPRLLTALQDDLGKPATEAYASELGLVLRELELARGRLGRWVRPEPRPTPLLNWPARSYILPEPRGVVLILGPWNYPLQLLLLPLVGALGAGNCAVLKPSEYAPHTAQALGDLLAGIFPPEYCSLVPGDARRTQEFLTLPWDHIFFTGSTAVGRLVMQAAARHPTSVTLELGGKNPCLVMADAPLEVAAERIAWGKFFNAGQTCGAPDHCYVQRPVREAFTAALSRVLQRFYGPDPAASASYGRIVSAAHLERLLAYLPQGRVIHGGQFDRARRFLAPTLMTDVLPDAAVMQDEIFGPVLPILPFDDLDALLDRLRDRPKPLAAYLFTRDRGHREKFLSGLAAGTMAVNETLSQIGSPHLPLGGVGASGLGRYHGRETFSVFSHFKSVLAKGYGLNLRMKYPPYRLPLAWLKRLYRWLM